MSACHKAFFEVPRRGSREEAGIHMQEAEEFHTWQVNQYWYPGGTAGVFEQGILNPAEVWALPFSLSFNYQHPGLQFRGLNWVLYVKTT